MVGTDDPRPLILGGGAVPFKRYRDGSAFRDWVRVACREAFDEAGLGLRDVDAVVVASESDFFSLQLNPAALVVDEIGLVPCPAIRVESGGASGAAALRTGLMHIMSGLAKRVLIVGFEHTGGHLSGEDVRLLYGLSFDAELEGMAGVSAAALYALSIQEHMDRYGTTVEQLAAVSVKNHGNATKNPWAHKPMNLTIKEVLESPIVSTPYRRLDCSPISDGAAALILCHPREAPSSTDPRVTVAGSGCATDHVRLGDRGDRHKFRAKEHACAAAYAMARIRDPGKEIHVAEVYDAFTGAEIQGIEALGMREEGKAAAALAAGEFGPGGRLPINLSGGLIGQGSAPGAVGILQAVTIQRLLSGRYWAGLQPRTDLRVGVADAHGGVATVCYTHVFERLG